MENIKVAWKTTISTCQIQKRHIRNHCMAWILQSASCHSRSSVRVAKSCHTIVRQRWGKFVNRPKILGWPGNSGDQETWMTHREESSPPKLPPCRHTSPLSLCSTYWGDQKLLGTYGTHFGQKVQSRDLGPVDGTHSGTLLIVSTGGIIQPKKNSNLPEMETWSRSSTPGMAIGGVAWYTVEKCRYYYYFCTFQTNRTKWGTKRHNFKAYFFISIKIRPFS